MNARLVVHQSHAYARAGVGLGGALLKHSLVPLSLLLRVLPERGLLLDLGCGEGVLANLVAASRPGLRVRGVDRDLAKVALANKNAPSNAHFDTADILDCSFRQAAAAVFNDVLHHHPTSAQTELLKRAATLLDADGVLIVKDVDARDRADRVWTSFWDMRLYPADELNFRSVEEWRIALFDAGFRVLEVCRMRHPWPASRTVLICRRRNPASVTRAVSNPVRVLVTGGTGFIGRHLVKQLVQHGLAGRAAEVTVLARNHSRIPAELDGLCHVMNGDLESAPALPEVFGEMEYVFHLAADKDFFGGRRVFIRNVKGTKSLIDVLRCSTKLKRLVFASSIGALDRAPEDDCVAPLVEDSQPHPTSHYGRAKYECERLIAESSLPFAILRLPWCYGPGMTSRTHVRSLAESVMRGGVATRFDWPGRVTLLDVKEAVRALVWAATEASASGRPLFVTDGAPIRLGALFREIGRVTGRRAGDLPVPRAVERVVRLCRRALPFTIRSLFLDTLWVDDRKIRELGFAAAPRREGFLLPLIRFVNSEARPSIHRSQALVTGAASGIGRALAIQLSASGRRVILVDCDPSVVEAVATIPGASSHLEDLVTGPDLDEVRRLLEADDVNLVINCAGVGHRGNLASAEPKILTTLIGVNVHALTQLSLAAVKNFQSAGDGVLVNIASSAALQPLPGMAAYAASKVYTLNFSEALAAEFTVPGIAIVTVCPSGVFTRFQETAGVRVLPHEKLLTPEEVAAATLRAVNRRRSRTVFVGRRTHLASLAARALPRRLNLRLWKRLINGQR